LFVPFNQKEKRHRYRPIERELVALFRWIVLLSLAASLAPYVSLLPSLGWQAAAYLTLVSSAVISLYQIGHSVERFEHYRHNSTAP